MLVTGADGFIGSHLVERLVGDGVQVRGLCYYNSAGSYGFLDALAGDCPRNLELLLGDVRDARLVRDAVADVDIVLHLAALIGIPYSYHAPQSYLETNVFGTLNVLEAVRDAGTVRMVQTSTSEVYGTPDSVPIRETHKLNGQSPYAASKIGADQMCGAYACSFDTPVVTLRPFNTYGPRQSRRAVIPTILSQLMSGVEEVHLGSLSPRRDLTFVQDTVRGFALMAAADLEPGSVVQLGTGVSVSVAEIFDLCCSAVDAKARAVTDDRRVRPEASEIQILQSDPSRARALLGWDTSVSLLDGLGKTVRWLASSARTDGVTGYQL